LSSGAATLHSSFCTLPWVICFMNKNMQSNLEERKVQTVQLRVYETFHLAYSALSPFTLQKQQSEEETRFFIFFIGSANQTLQGYLLQSAECKQSWSLDYPKMPSKKVQTKPKKSLVLQIIIEQRNTLFAPFSSRITNDKNVEARQKVLGRAKSVGLQTTSEIGSL